MLISVL